jgi:hypothetical protein
MFQQLRVFVMARFSWAARNTHCCPCPQMPPPPLLPPCTQTMLIQALAEVSKSLMDLSGLALHGHLFVVYAYMCLWCIRNTCMHMCMFACMHFVHLCMWNGCQRPPSASVQQLARSAHELPVFALRLRCHLALPPRRHLALRHAATWRRQVAAAREEAADIVRRSAAGGWGTTLAADRLKLGGGSGGGGGVQERTLAQLQETGRRFVQLDVNTLIKRYRVPTASTSSVSRRCGVC